jgi:hypothetical protein
LKALEMSQIHPPEDLIKLSQEFLKKVKKEKLEKLEIEIYKELVLNLMKKSKSSQRYAQKANEK